jgi:[ribosomal protein S18]-alanine N-acetyltransferase
MRSMENFEKENLIAPHLRKVTEDDIQKLLELEKSVSGNKIYSPMLEEDEWKEELKTNSVFLIENNNQVVGNISYEKKDDDHIYISGLVVDPRFQGQGIAKKALQQILEEFKDVKRVDLVTHPENPALRLYESLGFVVESRNENYYGDGEPRLTLVLKK